MTLSSSRRSEEEINVDPLQSLCYNAKHFDFIDSSYYFMLGIRGFKLIKAISNLLDKQR